MIFAGMMEAKNEIERKDINDEVVNENKEWMTIDGEDGDGRDRIYK